MLNNKKILLISPKFFGYEKEIKLKMESLGAKVDFFDERPANTFLVKAIIRLNKKVLIRKINRYFNELIAKTKNVKYDYVLFVNPESISKKLLLKLKNKQKDAEFILYMWDSLRNKKTKEILDCFDKKFSFDKVDCENKDYKMIYRPLFYLDDYSRLSNTKHNIEFDLLFIGTLHSDRNKVLDEIKKECKKYNLNFFFYLYFPSKILYYLKKIYDKSLWGTNISDFHFSSLSKEEVVDYINRSLVVLDIQHPKQEGLTMRTIEMLGAKKKIITTNKKILDYDFYMSENIEIIDREKVQLNNSFFKKKIEKVNLEVYSKYSLEGWLKDIIIN